MGLIVSDDEKLFNQYDEVVLVVAAAVFTQ
jgi:hypothetical protein